MKPSDRIIKIAQMLKANGTSLSDQQHDTMCNMIDATMAYLDEDKERVNGILHEVVRALHDSSFDTQNCNYLHAMIDETLEDNT